MSVDPPVTTQPGSAPRLPQKRDWHSGICGCFEDCESCICTTFCPVFYVCCCLSQRVGEHCCTPMLVPDVLVSYRVKVRTRYNIRGSIIKDCCCVACCGPCTICQLARELKFLAKQNGGHAFPKT